MYSRNTIRSEYRIPEHYSGVAFKVPKKSDPSEEKRDAAGRPSALPKEKQATIIEDKRPPQKTKTAPINWSRPIPLKADTNESQDEAVPNAHEPKLDLPVEKKSQKPSGFFDSDAALIGALILLLLGSSNDNDSESDSQTLLLLLLILIY